MVSAQISRASSTVPVLAALLAMAGVAQTTTSATWARILATMMPLATTPTAHTRAPATMDTLAMDENAWMWTSAS